MQLRSTFARATYLDLRLIHNNASAKTAQSGAAVVATTRVAVQDAHGIALAMLPQHQACYYTSLDIY